MTFLGFFCFSFSSLKRIHSQSDVIRSLFFLLNVFFAEVENDNYISYISKTHLNKAEQIIRLNFYLRLQNKENIALSVSRHLNAIIKRI